MTSKERHFLVQPLLQLVDFYILHQPAHLITHMHKKIYYVHAHIYNIFLGSLVSYLLGTDFL